MARGIGLNYLNAYRSAIAGMTIALLGHSRVESHRAKLPSVSASANRRPSSAAPSQGTFGRWGYVPQYRVFVLVNHIDQNAWVFRLTN